MDSSRRRCFPEDDGLASLAEMQPGHSCYYGHLASQTQSTANAPLLMMRRRNSLRNIPSLSSSSSSLPSPRGAFRLPDPRFDDSHSPHFLESCFLCKKPLGGNRDIFMYRGDTPFCSQECRQEQIEMDEAKEKKRNFKVLRSKKDTTKSNSSPSSSPTKRQNYPFRTGTVAAA